MSVRSQWVRLGVNFTDPPLPAGVDLEEALILSLAKIQEDPRLFWGIASWLHEYGSLVDGRRLSLIWSQRSTSPLLAALIVASRSPFLRSLLRCCRPFASPQPLFSEMASNPVLHNKVQKGALPQFLRWGILLDDWSLRLDAIRPRSWVFRHNPYLRLRALMGADLRSEVFWTISQARKALTASDLGRCLHRQYASVHATLAQLWVGGLLERQGEGRRVLYSVPKRVLFWLKTRP
jgi:hypothetical protein